MDDQDIWRSAKTLIERHGNDASIHAAMRADELLDDGDLDDAATWRRVIQAIKELETTEPDGSADYRSIAERPKIVVPWWYLILLPVWYNWVQPIEIIGAPGKTRTPNLLIRSQVSPDHLQKYT